MRFIRISAFISIVSLIALIAPTAQARITGSAHDFTGEPWNPTGQICMPCHTPHHANITVVDSPLWNHAVTVATFQLYQSSTMDATDLTQPSGRSKLCLSCHDGTVALDAFGGRFGTSFIGAGGLIGTDLRNDHPISFTYDDNLAIIDGELFAPSAAASGLGGTIQTDLLFANKMECSSCHDVHNTPGIPRMLVKSNVGSALCLTCHDK
jgi:predicted CXXCH cytochrome family protein